MTIPVIASTVSLLVLAQPMIAEAAHIEPMSGWQQLGVCGGCFATMALQSIQTRRGMRDSAVEHKEGLIALAVEHKEGLIALAVEVGGLRNDIKENMEYQIEELRKK